MKKIIALLSVLMLVGLFVRETKAQENTETLWLMGEELVKPDMINQYYEVCKELAELCKAEDFPYSYYVWVSQPFHYYISYPIQEMNDLAKIEKAWKGILEKYGEEKYRKFQECIESQTEKVMVGLSDLSYVPETSGQNEEDVNYCYWQEISVKKGSEKAVEELFKKAIGIMKEKGSEMGTFIGKGKFGYDQPMYFAWSYAKDQIDFLKQEEKFSELVGEDWKQINEEIVKHIKGINNMNFWYIKDLSYQKAE